MSNISINKNFKRFIEAVYMYLVDNDPGYERIKQAIKTVFSTLIAVLVFVWFFPGGGTLLAGFCAGSLSICHDGENTGQQMISMLIASVTFILSACFGMLLTGHTLWFYFIFVLACFCAFYVREKYGPRYISFPVFALLIMLISFNLPYELYFYYYLIIAFTGCLISFIVNFCIMPVNMELQFKHNFDVFLYKYNNILDLLMAGVNKSKSDDYYSHIFIKIDSLTDKLRNERLLSRGLPINVNRKKRMTLNIVYQYELFKLLSMINESLINLSRLKLDTGLRPLKSNVLKELSNLVISVRGLLSCELSKKSVSFEHLDKYLAKFKNAAFKSIKTGSESTSIVYLSNFAFAADRIARIFREQVELLKDKGTVKE